MSERAYVSHRTPTRLRIRVPARRHDTRWWQQVGERLRAEPGVGAVETNPATAGMLIVHDGRFDPARASQVAELGPLQLVDGAETRTAGTLLDRTNAALDGVDARLKSATGGTLDLASAALVGLTSLALLQLLRGNIGRTSAITLAWYASELMRTRAIRNAPG